MGDTRRRLWAIRDQLSSMVSPDVRAMNRLTATCPYAFLFAPLALEQATEKICLERRRHSSHYPWKRDFRI
jgi:hypothetical protein